jgi:hypothetical protein
MPKAQINAQDWAESVAVQALTFLAEDPERLGTFLALSGLGPESIRGAAMEPGFLAGVLDHVAANEKLLVDFASRAGLSPQEVERAHTALSGERWQRDTP